YTIPFAFFVVQIGLITRYSSMKKTRCWFIMACINAFLIGGASYVTSLVSIIITFMILLAQVYAKNKAYKKTIVVWLINLMGFILCVTAPGNMIRQQEFGERLSPFAAIKMSFYYAGNFFAQWINGYTLIMAVFIAIFAVYIALHNKCKFRFPALVAVMSYCVYAAHFTPTCYVWKYYGPPRLMNLIYFALMALIFFNIIYTIGWATNKVKDKLAEQGVDPQLFAKAFTDGLKKYAVVSIGVVFVCFTVMYYGYGLQGYSITGEALQSMASGEMQNYGAQQKDRFETFTNPEIKAVEIQPLWYKPRLLCYSDFAEDETNWWNVSAARFYDKEYIKVVQPAPAAE
ncbi:MAG: DUF6056 family protein, partial [Oscillospiraceae bacterium]